MSASALAAASAAAAVYYFAKGCKALDEDAPVYTYGETLGRWRTADLLIGLAYLSRKEAQEHPAADIARQARPLGEGMSLEQLEESMAELEVVERFMRYCFVMRERKMQTQRDMFASLGIGPVDLLMHEMRAQVLKPSFVLLRDERLRSIVLSIRGTHSFKDMFTSLTGASKPHHMVDSNGVVLGYSHFGMLAAARWIKQQTLEHMERALADNPGYSLRIVGHSLGGGTAALLTMMLREKGGPFAGATCLALACPSCMTLELARSCGDYVTSLVHGADVIPTVSPGSADRLREEVTRSSWSLEFRRDLRASPVVRAVESGLRGMSSATWTATSWTTAKLSACYPRRRVLGGRTLKRRNSDDWTGREDYGVASAADEAQAILLEAQQQEQRQGTVATGSPGASSNATVAAMYSATSVSVLGMLESPGAGSAQQQQAQRVPAGLAGSSLALSHHSEGGATGVRRGAIWGRRLAGWGQRVGALTGRGASALGSGSAAAVRGTGGLLSRVWSQSCRLPETPRGSGGDPGATDTSGAGPADANELPSSPPSRPSMEHEGLGRAEEEVEDAMEAADSAALARELTLRMSEVEAAVEDAEQEEAREGEDSAVPAVIRPGSYGATSPSHRHSPARDPQWRRKMYPAGRILHLVPACLLEVQQGDEDGRNTAPAINSQRDCDECSSDQVDCVEGGTSSFPGSPLWDGPECPAASSDQPSGKRQQQGRQQWVPGHSSPPAATAAVHWERRDAQRTSRPLVTDLGLQDPLDVPPPSQLDPSSGGGASPAREEPSAAASPTRRTAVAAGPSRRSLDGACPDDGVWVGSAGAQANSDAGESEAAAEPAASGGYALLDWVPQEAYGRIKLCRRMLADHFIPTYLAAMESAQRRLQRQRAALLAEQQQEEEKGNDSSEDVVGGDAAVSMEL
ncbi:hypothetical protein N2152v2_000230 [Parachlorella kessleri]